MKGHTRFLRGGKSGNVEYIDDFRKSSSPEPLGQFQPDIRVTESQICSNKATLPFLSRDINKIAKMHLRRLRIYLSTTAGPMLRPNFTDYPWVEGIHFINK